MNRLPLFIGLLFISSCGGLFNHGKKNYSGLRAFHQGWIQAKALGGRQPAALATQLSATSASVTLGWNAMRIPLAEPTSYNIYRSTSSRAQDFSQPLATGISSTSYTDTTVNAETTYYYVVRPVIDGFIFSTQEADSEIQVRVPPVNMGLVHRWIANYEMCSNLMGRTPDRTNNYRCNYTGPLSTNGFYDYGHDQFWDLAESGCNYTPANLSNPALSCNNGTVGCSGSGNPTTNSVPGGANQVFYDTNQGFCYLWSSGTTWTVSTLLSGTNLTKAISNQPGLPPLARGTQVKAHATCQQITVAGVGSKRLPKRSEQIVAAAWPTTYSSTQIADLEGGRSLPTTGNCNVKSGDGVDSFDAEAFPLGALVTGSNATKNCISLHGLQDMIGNMNEWSSDQMNCSTSTHTCTGIVGSIDSSNTDWTWNSGALSLPYSLDGITGPGGTEDGQTAPNYTYVWALEEMTYGGTYFLPALGMPAVSRISTLYDAIPIGTGRGQIDPIKIKANYNVQSENGIVTRGAQFGGSYTGGNRFTFRFIDPPSVTSPLVGSRCVVDLPPL